MVLLPISRVLFGVLLLTGGNVTSTISEDFYKPAEHFFIEMFLICVGLAFVTGSGDVAFFTSRR